jgi:predicted phage terminase large subunit-like protein
MAPQQSFAEVFPMHVAQLTAEEQADLLASAERELAQRSLVEFCHRMDSNYIDARHTKLVIEHLEQLERGDIKNLAVFMPPRHSKTYHCSERFPAWYLGRHPKHHVLTVGYNQDLSNVVSRRIRDIVGDERYPFEDVTIRDDSRAVEQWTLNKGGGLIAAGIGGSITGKGAHLLVLDDVIKSREDIDSLEKRDNMFQWYAEVAFTRLMPGGKCLYVTTRWGDDDLAARVVASSDEWTVLRLPAIAEEHDALGREPGEALWPDAYPIERLEKIREVQGSRSFAALYQQNPTPADGTAVKASWLEHRYDVIPKMETWRPTKGLFSLPGTLRCVEREPLCLQAVDASWGQGTSSDYSAIATVFYDYHNFYVADVWRGRVTHPDLVKMIEAKFHQFRPRTVIIEKAQAGHAVLQSLQVLNRVPIYGVVPRSSKEARLDAVLPLFEAGRVRFPRQAPWLEMTFEELLRFPNASHDDIVDALAYALNAICEGVKVHLIDPDAPSLRSLVTGRAIA